jgi:hypothetical protein
MREFRDIMGDNLLACALFKSEAHPGYGLFEGEVTSNAFSLAQAKGLFQVGTCLSPCSPAS